MSKTANAVKADKETLHYAGHRQRLRERFLKSGAGALADYELLEIILYGASPHTDTKPFAKKLLSHFGRFAAVIHATPIELAQVEGMGEAAICCNQVYPCKH